MSLYILSFVAWLVTILAPCVLPILPVIVWWSVIDGQKSRPRVIILSFAITVFVLTLGVKFLVDNLWIFPDDLAKASAILLIIFGIVLLFPNLWSKLMHMTWIEWATNKAQSTDAKWIKGDIILGIILWPVFNTCSPTFAVLVSTILPASFFVGIVHILLYILWLVIILSAVAYGGRAAISKLKWAADPNGRFKKAIAILLIFLWFAMLMWRHKSVEARILENWFSIDTTNREVDSLDSMDALE